jgi:hypothetical protein
VTSKLISQIKHEFTECVVLLLKGSLFRVMKDITVYITYISPEGSTIYRNNTENTGFALLDDHLLNLKHDFPNYY